MIGTVISVLALVAPKAAFRLRCKAVDRILSTHTETYEQKWKVLYDVNKFLEPLPKDYRQRIMKEIGVQDAPSWTTRVHTGDA